MPVDLRLDADEQLPLDLKPNGFSEQVNEHTLSRDLTFDHKIDFSLDELLAEAQEIQDNFISLASQDSLLNGNLMDSTYLGSNILEGHVSTVESGPESAAFDFCLNSSASNVLSNFPNHIDTRRYGAFFPLGQTQLDSTAQHSSFIDGSEYNILADTVSGINDLSCQQVGFTDANVQFTQDASANLLESFLFYPVLPRSDFINVAMYQMPSMVDDCPAQSSSDSQGSICSDSSSPESSGTPESSAPEELFVSKSSSLDSHSVRSLEFTSDDDMQLLASMQTDPFTSQESSRTTKLEETKFSD